MSYRKKLLTLSLAIPQAKIKAYCLASLIVSPTMVLTMSPEILATVSKIMLISIRSCNCFVHASIQGTPFCLLYRSQAWRRKRGNLQNPVQTQCPCQGTLPKYNRSGNALALARCRDFFPVTKIMHVQSSVLTRELDLVPCLNVA